MPLRSVPIVGGSQPWIQWSWVEHHWGDIGSALGQHVELTLIAVGVGFALSLPMGLLAWRWRRFEKPVYGFTGLLFTIPSLALFAFLIPITGLGPTTAEIGLVSYTLLILVRNIVAGLNAVPGEVRDAARGLGFSRTKELVRVDLPLASPAIIAGIRLAVVTTIGLVTVASLAGAGGGLGTLISVGFQNNFRTQEVLGAGLSVLLAAVFDVTLVVVQRFVTPWAAVKGGA
ncbi:MAG TPA: ABC transporter permease [Acidimicrobiales bacterium]|nr:ABC transporter permease [Acidimicrobiales bacterium]